MRVRGGARCYDTRKPFAVTYKHSVFKRSKVYRAERAQFSFSCVQHLCNLMALYALCNPGVACSSVLCCAQQFSCVSGCRTRPCAQMLIHSSIDHRHLNPFRFAVCSALAHSGCRFAFREFYTLAADRAPRRALRCLHAAVVFELETCSRTSGPARACARHRLPKCVRSSACRGV